MEIVSRYDNLHGDEEEIAFISNKIKEEFYLYSSDDEEIDLSMVD